MIYCTSRPHILLTLQIFVDSISEEKIGTIFEPKSLIQVLANLMYSFTDEQHNTGNSSNQMNTSASSENPMRKNK